MSMWRGLARFRYEDRLGVFLAFGEAVCAPTGVVVAGEGRDARVGKDSQGFVCDIVRTSFRSAIDGL